MGKSTISTAIFNSFLYIYQRVLGPYWALLMVELPSPSGDQSLWFPQVFIVHQPSLPDKKGQWIPIAVWNSTAYYFNGSQSHVHIDLYDCYTLRPLELAVTCGYTSPYCYQKNHNYNQ